MHNKTNEGFTLIEVMITVAVLSIGLLALASMQITAVNDNASSSHRTEASTWAQDKMEALMALPFTHDNLTQTTPGNPHSDPTQPSDDYEISWTVDDDISLPDTKQITITVTWQERGLTKTVRLVSDRSMY